MAHIVIWEFIVPEGTRAEFERVYGADGEWAALFRAGRGFKGTEFAERYARASQTDASGRA